MERRNSVHPFESEPSFEREASATFPSNSGQEEHRGKNYRSTRDRARQPPRAPTRYERARTRPPPPHNRPGVTATAVPRVLRAGAFDLSFSWPVFLLHAMGMDARRDPE